MEITFYGHSCFSVHTEGKTLLFDPFIRPNPHAKHIRVEDLHADYVLISHAHEDHMADALEIARRCKSTIIGVYEVVNWFGEKGIDSIHPMNVGGGKNFDFGRVTLTPALHSSSFADGTYGGVAAGFVLEAAGKTIYYSGDTALFGDMKLIGSRFNINLALLPVGDNFTMDARDAATAARLLNCRDVLGVHYNTFGYIVIDPQKATEAFANEGVTLTLLNPGDKMKI